MGLRFWNGVVLAALGVLWLASGTQREHPVLGVHSAEVASAEAELATAPTDPAKVLALGQRYLDSAAPGMAVSLIESQPVAVKTNAAVEHLYARALLDQGRSADALAAEERVLYRCDIDPSVCTPFLIASANRRVGILRELARLGVDDAQAHPEKSSVAYHNATRQVGVVVLH
ncbi:MAG TPA: hypothetical protein PLR99_26680 [Polyangiaceae bacterium]|jgi:hypothetical protein|nr:hypothetical protein [Polyangiaceae bacterium]